MTSKKLEKCVKRKKKKKKNVKKTRKKLGKMCKNRFEKPEKCISINIE